MPKLNEQDKLIALAYLYKGSSAREVEEACANVSYAQALRLRKELDKAKLNDTVQELFNLEEAVLENLLSTVQENLSEAAEVLTGDYLPLEKAVVDLGDKVKNQILLEVTLSQAAVELTNKIKAAAVLTTNVDSLLILAESLSKLQTAYFKTNNVAIVTQNSFENLLKD